MKKNLLAACVGLASATVLPQQLSLEFGTRFASPKLEVRWNALINALPTQAWVYQLLPGSFSPTLISNLMAWGEFTPNDQAVANANEIVFRKRDLSSLWISTRLGAIEYVPQTHYGPTNLAHHVPAMSELPTLTTNLLNQLGIKIEDIEKRPDGSPNLQFSEPFLVYVVNHTFITNIQYRAVGFRRSVDGARFVGNGTGGDCHIEFGEYGKPSKIRLSWRNIQRRRAYPVAPPQTITKWIREGKAVQGMIRMDAEPIDWRTVKSMTITSAKLCYYAGGPFDPSDWLMPFVALWTTVDRGHGTIDVEIDCPLIDDTKM